MTLTKTQRAILVRAATGEILHYMPYMGRFNPNPYFFWHAGGHERNPRCDSVEKLLGAKLLEWFRRNALGEPSAARITSAGRQEASALAQEPTK